MQAGDVLFDKCCNVLPQTTSRLNPHSLIPLFRKKINTVRLNGGLLADSAIPSHCLCESDMSLISTGSGLGNSGISGLITSTFESSVFVLALCQPAPGGWMDGRVSE